MITREFQKGDAASTAVYSPCERYRYLLTRVWDPAGARALFVMLNPPRRRSSRTTRRWSAASGGRGRWGSGRSG